MLCEKVEIFAKVSLWEKTLTLNLSLTFLAVAGLLILTITGCITVRPPHTSPLEQHTQSWKKISLFMFRNIGAFYFCNNLAGPLSHQ